MNRPRRIFFRVGGENLLSQSSFLAEALMLRWQTCLLICVAVVAIPFPAPCFAQTTPEIESARVKGMDYIKGEQYDDGSWALEGHDVGITSLCAMGLIENGVPVSDPVIDKAHRFVQKEMENEKGTYDIALAILFLSRVGDRDNRSKIRDLAARLIAGQTVEGGWSYTCPLASVGILSNSDERPKLQPGVGDNSCTQFAVLGLWVSSRWGVDITSTMSLVGDRFIETQREDGGWPYAPEEWTKLVADADGEGADDKKADAEKEKEKGTDGKPKMKKKEDKYKDKDKNKDKDKPVVANALPGNKALPGAKAALPGGIEEALPGAGGAGGTGAASAYQPSSPSMTFAGLFCLTVARAAVIRQEQSKTRVAVKPGSAPNGPAAEGDTLMSDPSFADGLKKAGEFAASLSAGSPRYFMWSVERMGVVLGMEKFGETDWFGQGSAALIASQAANGSWGDLSDTSFAILFLRKANLGSDISRLLSGEPADRFQIVSQAERPRFNTLDDALKAAQEGDRIRIDGTGPFLMPHLEVERDLTIEAGFGYQPVFRYDVGYDKDGRRSRPQENAETRHMVRVTKGTLTLEGVELQMDAPELGANIPWAAVVVNGGTLRMLNCSISEGNKQGMAAVRITAPGTTVLQNCQLVGGRSALEIQVTGDQHVTLDNCIVFSKIAFSLSDGEKAEGSKCSLSLSHSAVQASEVFACKGLTHPLDIVSNGIAYQGEWMGQNMLATPTTHPGLSWTGDENLYDLKRWVGSAGKPNATVKDSKSWSKFWGGSDANGSNRTIPFAGRKPMGGFNHSVKGEDFEFASESAVYAYRRKTGIDPLLVGPGAAFLRYRESFDYRTWVANSDTPATEAK